MYISLAMLGGLVVLVLGADWLVKGASRLAFSLGVPPLIVGLTVVAFGTSAPELAVTVRAALAGEAGVGLGNVFGSNTINILLVLGISAAIVKLPVSPQLLRVDVPFMIAVSLGAYLMAWDGVFNWVDGAILVLGLCLYLAIQVYLGKSHEDIINELIEPETAETRKSAWQRLVMPTVLCVFGFFMLVIGAHYLVDGSVRLASLLGVSDEIVGLTVVSVGTSMPEIVTSIVAAAQGKREMAIGNIVGSNLFNLMAVLGIASCVSPEAIPVSEQMMRIDLPVMLIATIACWPIFYTGRVISRNEGAVMLICYIAYIGYQVYHVLSMQQQAT